MAYRTPVEDILFTLRRIAGVDDDLLGEVVAQAGRFADEEIAPLNAAGDRAGARLVDGAVETAPGWKEVYRRWADAGWNGIRAPEAFGGQGLSTAAWAATTEIWSAACMAFGVCPLLSQGAIEALLHHAPEDLRTLYLPKLVAGTWTGTMNLTEPQAGSDLGALRTRAEPAGDGSYRITGQKIFITYGEQDLTENIVHLVLARLPDAPAGTRGISLFLVPKFLVGADGTLGARNDLRCAGIEHKLGIRASPTCTMVFGDNGGATGFLIGAENRGLVAMFTMMNDARLAVGLQGVGIAERAFQQALAFARERRQGRAPGAAGDGPSPIAGHPDVRRMLLTMKALTAAARAICYRTAAAVDRGRDNPAAQSLAELLTPIAKAFSTDVGVEVASLGIQVHGGMGYIEETGAAQHLRDARIASIYEGTNGIQAIDLVTRKLAAAGGATLRGEIAEISATAEEVRRLDDPAFGATAARLAEAAGALDRAATWLTAAGRAPEEALAGATPFLRLFGLAVGGAALARGTLVARRDLAAGENPAPQRGRVALARFFAENILPSVDGLARRVTDGAESVVGDDARAVLAGG